MWTVISYIAVFATGFIVGLLFARRNPKDVQKTGEIADKVEDKVGKVYKDATKNT